MKSENSYHMSCPICGGVLTLLNSVHPGYQKPLTFSIYECKFCDSQIAYPLSPKDGIYNLIYKNGEKIPGYSRYFRIMTNIKKQGQPLDFLSRFEDMYWFVVNYLMANDAERNWKILEIGSGLGYLTYALKKAGWDVKGIDIAANAVEYAEKEFGPFYINDDVIQYSQNNHESYDVVVMIEVIEHLTDIFSMMDAVHKLLKPNGVALITTPNKSFYPPGTYWITGNPPVHFWWLSEKSMVYIAIKTGFYVTFCNFTRFNLKDFSIAPKASKLADKPSPAWGPTFDEFGNILRFDTYKMNNKLKRYMKRSLKYILPKVVYECLVNALGKSTPVCKNLWRSKSLGTVFHKIPSENDRD